MIAGRSSVCLSLDVLLGLIVYIEDVPSPLTSYVGAGITTSYLFVLLQGACFASRLRQERHSEVD
jgi:hypothetical protein